MIGGILKKLVFPLEQPEELKTRKAKVTYAILAHMYLLDTGRGKIFGKFTTLFNDFALVLLIIDKLGYMNLSMTQIIFFSILGMMVVWFGGWLYIILSIDKVEGILHRYRDVMFRNLWEVVKEGKPGDKK